MLVGHKRQWELLKKRFENDQLAHAYLFTGSKEIGKKTFAIEFAKLISCKEQNRPCQKCFSCQAIEKESFPDFMILREANKKDEKFGDGGDIKISQIKKVQNFLSYKSYYGGFKVVVVDDAEKMNQEAQSCFLKTLEEPKGKTLIILVSSRSDLVLRTIVSRCQTIKFHRPKDLAPNPERVRKEEEILKEILAVSGSNLAEKFKYTKSLDFEKQSLSDILEVLEKYLRRILLQEISPKDISVQKARNAINLIEDINNKMIFTNANPKLALEILLMEL